MVAEVQEGFQPEATTSFEATALHGLTDITASPGKVVCTLPIKDRVKNRYQTLHGGCTGEWQSHTIPHQHHSREGHLSVDCQAVTPAGPGACPRGSTLMLRSSGRFHRERHSLLRL